jgi:hypothetical protein
MITAASDAGAAESDRFAASPDYQANTVPKPVAAEATHKRHAPLILASFNRRADTQCDEHPQGNRGKVPDDNAG